MPIVPICCRPTFAARSTLRIVEADDTRTFKGINDITRQQIMECPALADLCSLDPVPYLAEFMAMPGLVKGASNYAYGHLVYSENLKHYTRVCSSRVAGNKIKFNYGSEEFKENRDDCWEFCVKRVRISIIQKQTRLDVESFPLVLTREEDSCPICYDKLTSQVVCCKSNHQTCLNCWSLLPGHRGNKKCVLCNTANYSDEELEKVDKMNGRVIQKDPYYYLDIKSCANSFKDYTYNEALFFGMIKNMCRNESDIFNSMLLSGLYNYYMTHPESFSDYQFNILNQVDYNNRTYNPFHDDVNPVIEKYLDIAHTPQIYNDIAHTTIYMSGYDDIQFFRELEHIEGNVNRLVEYPNQSKSILQREIFFRYKLDRLSHYELKETMNKLFQRIAKKTHQYEKLFNIIKQEVESCA